MALQQLADKSYGMTFPGLSVEETLERLSEACRSKGPAYGFSLPYQMPLEIARSGDRIVAFHLGRHPFAVFEGRLQREKDETKLTFTALVCFVLIKLWVDGVRRMRV